MAKNKSATVSLIEIEFVCCTRPALLLFLLNFQKFAGRPPVVDRVPVSARKAATTIRNPATQPTTRHPAIPTPSAPITVKQYLPKVRLDLLS